MYVPDRDTVHHLAAHPRTAARRLARRTGYGTAIFQLLEHRYSRPARSAACLTSTTNQTVSARERHRRHQQHHCRRRGPARPACRQQCLGVEFRRQWHDRSDQLFYPAKLFFKRQRLGLDQLGSRGVPTRTPASRANTPAAATFCSSMGPSTSSSSRSTCSPIAPSAAATAARSQFRRLLIGSSRSSLRSLTA